MAAEPHLPAEEKIPHLTPRERDVLRLLCHPACYLEKAIPELLGFSRKTCETHRANLYKKLNVHSRQELLHKAVALKLVPCPCGQGGAGA